LVYMAACSGHQCIGYISPAHLPVFSVSPSSLHLKQWMPYLPCWHLSTLYTM
jgi:hypothetical protein